MTTFLVVLALLVWAVLTLALVARRVWRKAVVLGRATDSVKVSCSQAWAPVIDALEGYDRPTPSSPKRS